MGRTSRWLRSLLSSKKSQPEPPAPAPAKERKKTKWALSKSANNSGNLKNVEDPLASPYVEGLDANKHAIAVAAATAAVAEAALAAAQAAAEVVRLTSGTSGSGRTASAYVSTDRRRVAAAVKIQSAFRAYLARRALRALKGLVKLQALVRGHIVRKQSADMLRRMQAMARIQARASATRAYTTELPNVKNKFSNSRISGTVNVNKYQQRSNSGKHGGSALKQYNAKPRVSNNANKERSYLASNWLDHWMEQCTPTNGQDETSQGDDERSDKILEIDTWKPHARSGNDKTFPSSHYLPTWNDHSMGHEYPKLGSVSRLAAKLQKPNPSVSSEEVSSVRSHKFLPEGEQVATWTAAENSPRVHSASPRAHGNLMRGPFTPARSECSRSVFGDYLGGHPNYMSNTESSRAKVRSQSAPKQRMQLEELSQSADFARGIWDSDVISEKGFPILSNYRNNGYVYSGHLKRPGGPTRAANFGFSSSYGRKI